MRRLVITVFALFLSAAAPAFAQEEPPARVGRVAYVSGNLAFHMPGETQWSAAAVNYPVATGGSFWTEPKTRAEFRIGAQTIDLDGDTEVDVANLDEQVLQLALPQGRINLHVRQLDQGNTAEIDIPRGGVWLLQPGIYDIAAGSADQPARIAVFEGSARFVGGGVDLGIKAGQAAIITGTGTLTANIEKAVPDAFAEWCRSRDYHEPRLAAPYYVSPHMTGYAELDEYGTWGESADYGRVWYPRSVSADWAPYREGHWVSIEPWGWTWVDAEPWGFAPFHYGRWARIGGRWGWLPGRFVPRPVYAPALVAFVGDPGAGIAVAGAPGPAVGWFPLGPNEVYWPTYTRNPTYIRQVNITNVSQTKIVNITNVVVNQRAAAPPPQVVRQTFVNRSATTVVPVRVFANAAPVAPAVVHVAPQVIRRAPVSVRPPRVTPVAARVAPAHPAQTPPPITNAAPSRPPAPAKTPPANAPSAAQAPVAPVPAHPPGRAPAPAAAVPPPAGPHTPAATHEAPPATASEHPAAVGHAPPAAAPHPPTAAHAEPHAPAPGNPAAAAHLPPPHAVPPREHPAGEAHAPPAAAHAEPHAPAPAHSGAAAHLPPPHAVPPREHPAAEAHAPPQHRPAAAAHEPPPHAPPPQAPHPVAAAPHPAPPPHAPPPQPPHPAAAAPHPAPAHAPPPQPPHPAAAAPHPAPAHAPPPHEKKKGEEEKK